MLIARPFEFGHVAVPCADKAVLHMAPILLHEVGVEGEVRGEETGEFRGAGEMRMCSGCKLVQSNTTNTRTLFVLKRSAILNL